MASENPWGAPRIHGELLCLGFDLSERSVSRYLRSLPRTPRANATWRTFLRNHRDGIAAMDFFTVPTAMFRVLQVFLVTTSPTAACCNKANVVSRFGPEVHLGHAAGSIGGRCSSSARGPKASSIHAAGSTSGAPLFLLESSTQTADGPAAGGAGCRAYS